MYDLFKNLQDQKEGEKKVCSTEEIVLRCWLSEKNGTGDAGNESLILYSND